MVQINFAQKQVSAKIVYYGPGMSGKTTNLEVVHQRAPQDNRGDLTSISTDGDRTLFFDYMPLDLGEVAGMRTCLQVYTVPGQVYYNSTRKLVLQGVDGVIFVADSSASKQEENLESLENLEKNLNEYGKSLASMPHVIQYNKRDLPDALPVDQLNQTLNKHGAPTFEAVANTGQGVFPTLKALAAGVLKHIVQEKMHDSPAAAPAESQTGFHKTGFHKRESAVGVEPAARSQHAPASARPAQAPAAAPVGRLEVAGAPQGASAGAPSPYANVANSHPGRPYGGGGGVGGPGVAPGAAPTANPRGGMPARPSNLMQVGKGKRPSPVPPRRGRVAPGGPGRSAASAPKAKPKAKSSSMTTVVFVVVAATVGALLAKVLLSSL